MKKYSAVLILAAMLVLTLAYSPAARATTAEPESTVYCTNASVGAFSVFNQDAECPSQTTAMGGGYQLTDANNGNILVPTVGVNIFLFGGSGGVQPIGWQTIGTNPSGESASIRVCVSCAKDEKIP